MKKVKLVCDVMFSMFDLENLSLLLILFLFYSLFFKCVVFKIFVFMLRQSDMEIMGFRHGLLLRLHVLLLTTGLH